MRPADSGRLAWRLHYEDMTMTEPRIYNSISVGGSGDDPDRDYIGWDDLGDPRHSLPVRLAATQAMFAKVGHYDGCIFKNPGGLVERNLMVFDQPVPALWDLAMSLRERAWPEQHWMVYLGKLDHPRHAGGLLELRRSDPLAWAQRCIRTIAPWLAHGISVVFDSPGDRDDDETAYKTWQLPDVRAAMIQLLGALVRERGGDCYIEPGIIYGDGNHWREWNTFTITPGSWHDEQGWPKSDRMHHPGRTLLDVRLKGIANEAERAEQHARRAAELFAQGYDVAVPAWLLSRHGHTAATIREMGGAL
jgi:hypothetical protein